MRKFWIATGNNEVINLMEKDTFGSSPSGLGVSVSSSMIYMGTDALITDEQIQYDKIEFTLIIGAESEEPYQKFVDFIKKLNTTKLTLHYQPDSDMEAYKREVVFVSVTKSELDRDLGVLASTISFQPTTPWYKWENAITQTTYQDKENLRSAILSFNSKQEKEEDKLSYEQFIPIRSKGNIHFMSNVTVPLEVRWAHRGTKYVNKNKITRMRIYKLENYELVEISRTNFDVGPVIGKIPTLTPQLMPFYLNSDYGTMRTMSVPRGSENDPDALGLANVEIYNPPGQPYIARYWYDMLRFLSTGSTGLLRIPPNELVYLWIDEFGDKETGLPDFEDDDFVRVKVERVVV